LWYWFYMQADFTDRRLSPRSKVSQHTRVRPSDLRQAEKIYNTANQSQTGLYFMTATGYYVPGMEVFVTRDFRPDDQTNREEKAVVVRVESLGGGHIGVAIHIESLLPKHVLFVCIGNCCRSPMAEALARHLAPDAIAASSAGVASLGYVSPSTRAVLAEIGISIAGQESKPLRERDVASADLLINMTGRPVFHARTPVEDWQVADPFGRDLAVYRRTRDEIERRVTELAKRLRASTATRRASER
jgi:arsenate reductase (thioredoxin)